jgi:hypothetical protein
VRPLRRAGSPSRSLAAPLAAGAANIAPSRRLKRRTQAAPVDASVAQHEGLDACRSLFQHETQPRFDHLLERDRFLRGEPLGALEERLTREGFEPWLLVNEHSPGELARRLALRRHFVRFLRLDHRFGRSIRQRAAACRRLFVYEHPSCAQKGEPLASEGRSRFSDSRPVSQLAHPLPWPRGGALRAEHGHVGGAAGAAAAAAIRRGWATLHLGGRQASGRVIP